MKFESRRFDVQHWQHCSVLKSVDGGTGRNRADFGLTPRAQVTGISINRAKIVRRLALLGLAKPLQTALRRPLPNFSVQPGH